MTRSVLAVRLLDLFTAPAYHTMTFPEFRPRLEDLSRSSGNVALGASHDGLPVGLALAEHLADRRGNLLSVFVSPDYRRRGVGTALVERTEHEFASRGCTQIDAVYTAITPSTQAVERILKKSGWSTPSPRVLLCCADRQIFEAPWMLRARLPAGFSIFQWCDLQPHERHHLLRQQQIEPWFPESLSPFREEDRQELLTSLGLRYHHEVVGWLITHRVSDRQVRYDSLFVRADVRRYGCALVLLREALHRHAGAYGLDSLGQFTVSVSNWPMTRFIRRIAPAVVSLRETRSSGKILRREPALHPAAWSEALPGCETGK